MTRGGSDEPPLVTRGARPTWHALLAIALLSLAAAAPSLGNGFVRDDVALIRNDPRVHALDAPWRFLAQPYWPHGTLYRPLTSIAFAVEWQLGRGAPWAYHGANVLLYLLVCLAVCHLASRLLGRQAGGWAAALFAVHPVHVEAVGNAVGQSELWAALCIVTALVWYYDARRAGRLTGRDTLVVAALYGTACLFKEHALLFPALLVATEIIVFRSPARAWVVEPSLRRTGVALALVAASVWAAHAAATGTFTGEAPAPPLANLSLTHRAMTMLGVVPEWARLLFFPAHLQADYMPQEIPLATGVGPRQLLGLALLALAGMIGSRPRRAPLGGSVVAWLGITLFPVSNLAAPTGILLAERTLFLPSVGAALGIGVVVRALARRRGTRTPRLRLPAVVAGTLILGVALERSARRQLVWRSEGSYIAALLADAPRSYVTHRIQAHLLARQGDRAGAEQAFRRALDLFGNDARLLGEVADRYSTQGRCGEALALYRRSLALEPAGRFDRARYRRCLNGVTPEPPPSRP
jgi:protein O-mannosyl-transferase